MQYDFDLHSNQNSASSLTASSIEYLQIQVKFEESFPFLELRQLLQILKNTTPTHRELLLPKALKVANKMKHKFANSLSPDYEKWSIEIQMGIFELQSYRTFTPTINSKFQCENQINE